MKKVLAISPSPYLPYSSGGQKFIALFFEYLGKQVDLTVISGKENNFSLVKNYQTIPLLKKSFSRYIDRSLIATITALIKEKNFDTLIIEHPYLAWLAFSLRNKTGIKVVIHTHNIEFQRFQSMGKWWWPVLQRYEKRSFKKADAIFFITPEDKKFAIEQWKIAASKCIDLPFGIEINSFPDDKEISQKYVAAKHGIEPGEKILLFTGALNYQPNQDAVATIVQSIHPILQEQNLFAYKIIICGKGMPDALLQQPAYKDTQLIFTGFVDDITVYYKGASIFLNPVVSGGGIKTKMVEAIAYGTTVVACKTGAMGIDKDVCGEKLQIVEDNDWPAFVSAIQAEINKEAITPSGFYERYYWENIIHQLTTAAVLK